MCVRMRVRARASSFVRTVLHVNVCMFSNSVDGKSIGSYWGYHVHQYLKALVMN